MPSALITGVSRRAGIAWAIAQRLHADGWSLSTSGWPDHDAAQPWGGDAEPPTLPGVPWRSADLADPATPARLVAEHVDQYGGVDAVVAVHARSSSNDLATVTAVELDLSYAVNTRSIVLLAQAAAGHGLQRLVFFATGVHQSPMADELAYAVTKGALQAATGTLAAALLPATVNCIHPGPVDTGYADPETLDWVGARMPLADRWGRPAEIAAAVAWVLSPEAGWMTGQTLDVDGGWGIRSGVPPRR